MKTLTKIMIVALLIAMTYGSGLVAEAAPKERVTIEGYADIYGIKLHAEGKGGSELSDVYFTFSPMDGTGPYDLVATASGAQLNLALLHAYLFAVMSRVTLETRDFKGVTISDFEIIDVHFGFMP
jgi:hypothetical protein